MKKLLFLAMLLSAGAARAIPLVDIYAGASGAVGSSVTFIPDGRIPGGARDLEKTSLSYGVVAGIDIPLVRIEAEYNRIDADLAKLDAAMLNAYIKLLPTPIVKPYAGLGVGSIFAGKIGGMIDQDVKAGAAFQGMLGLTLDLPVVPVVFDIEARALYADSIYDIPIIGQGIGFLQYDLRAKIRYVF